MMTIASLPQKMFDYPKTINMRTVLFFSMVFSLGLGSCATVKPYQKNRLNDSEMQLHSRQVEKPEMSFQTYREAASGANGGKTGGGCGCN